MINNCLVSSVQVPHFTQLLQISCSGTDSDSYGSVTAITPHDCGQVCLLLPECVAFEFDTSTATHNCFLRKTCHSTALTSLHTYVLSQGWFSFLVPLLILP